jgi:pantoate kinase
LRYGAGSVVAASGLKRSKKVFVPSAVSSFFEICDTELDGSKITDELRIGARGGGFVIQKGNTTQAFKSNAVDSVIINGKTTPQARTSFKVLELMRKDYDIRPVKITHRIIPPIGAGFGTSGAGAIGATIAVSDLFELRLTLSQASDYAHRAEIESVTGLGTVISLISGSGAMGLVTEPGSFSVGRVDSLLKDYSDYSLICASFGPIEKSTVLLQEEKRRKVNEFGHSALKEILKDRTPESLLYHSRIFAEKTGIASEKLLRIADEAKNFGAIGATQNMIGNAVHCLVSKSKRRKFLASFSRIVPRARLFESDLSQSGPRIF